VGAVIGDLGLLIASQVSVCSRGAEKAFRSILVPLPSKTGNPKSKIR